MSERMTRRKPRNAVGTSSAIGAPVSSAQSQNNHILQMQKNVGNSVVKKLIQLRMDSTQSVQSHQQQNSSQSMESHQQENSSQSKVVQMRLDRQYDFAGANAEYVNDIVYRVATLNGDTLIIKFNASMDDFTAKLALATGMNAPDSRPLDPDEITELKKIIPKIGKSSIVMENVYGQDLYDYTAEEMKNGEKKPITPEQLFDLGATVAFQIFMDGWDRWDMPYEGAANGQHNMGNIMIDSDEKVVLIDSDTSKVKDVDTYIKSIDGFIMETIADASGGELISMASDRLSKSGFLITEQSNMYMQKGFVQFITNLQGVDLDGLNPPDGQGRLDFLKDMQQYMISKINMPVVKKKKKKCYITTACMENRGLSDDCAELTTLRDFRDQYIQQLENGEQMIQMYYRYAPAIVEAINEQPDAAEIYQELYEIIRICVQAVHNEQYEYAYQIYINTVLLLQDHYQEAGMLH